MSACKPLTPAERDQLRQIVDDAIVSGSTIEEVRARLQELMDHFFAHQTPAPAEPSPSLESLTPQDLDPAWDMALILVDTGELAEDAVLQALHARALIKSQLFTALGLNAFGEKPE